MSKPFTTTLPISLEGIRRYDTFTAVNDKTLSAITNPLRSPLHPDALSWKEISPEMELELRNRNLKSFATATVDCFPYLEGNAFVVRLRIHLPSGDYCYFTCQLSAIGVTPDEDKNT